MPNPNPKCSWGRSARLALLRRYRKSLCISAFGCLLLIFFRNFSSVNLFPPTPSLCSSRPDYAASFYYPLPIANLSGVVAAIRAGHNVSVDPINTRIGSIKYAGYPLYFEPLDPIALLILVKSAAENYAKRTTLRQTWASSDYLGRFPIPIRHVFLLATGQTDGKLPAALRNEIERNKDMVVMDFWDSHRNLTYKTLGGLRWSIEKCSKFELLMTVDDDVWLSLKNAVDILKNSSVFPSSLNTKSSNSFADVNSQFGLSVSPSAYLLGGDVWAAGRGVPIRRDNRSSKFVVSWEEYPLAAYPPYVSGGAVLYSRSAAQDIYVASRFVKFLSFDDVYVGIIAAKLGIPITKLSPHFTFISTPPITENSTNLLQNSVAFLIPHTFKNRTTHMWWRYNEMATNERSI